MVNIDISIRIESNPSRPYVEHCAIENVLSAPGRDWRIRLVPGLSDPVASSEGLVVSLSSDRTDVLLEKHSHLGYLYFCAFTVYF